MHKDSSIRWKKWKFMGETKSKGGIGFKDLETFNKALLAQQIWRIIEHSDSLAGQTLKAKYFPNTGVLKAKLNHNPFLIWRSFAHSIGLIKECMLWRVGNGNSIHIWGDN